MNRLHNYFLSVKLAKAWLAQAEEYDTKDSARALHNVILAVRQILTAQNNIASIAFHQKPKARKP